MLKVNHHEVFTGMERLEATHERVKVGRLSITDASATGIVADGITFVDTAISDLARIFGIPKGYFGTVTRTTINGLFTELKNLKEVAEIQVLRNASGEVVRVGRGDANFIKVSQVAKALDEVKLMGGMFGMTQMRLFGKHKEATSPNEKFWVGADVMTDYFAKKSQVMISAFRVICTNGLVYPSIQEVFSVEAKSAGAIADMIEAANKGVDRYAGAIDTFYKRAMSIPLAKTPTEVIGDAFDSGKISKSMMKRAVLHAEAIVAGKDLENYSKDGITKMDNAWDMFNLFTMSARELNSVVGRFRAEISALEWALEYSKN